MRNSITHRAYSARACLLNLFVVISVVLGGGGSPNPLTEVLLELAFVLVALVWLWLPEGASGTSGPSDRLIIALIACMVIIPIAQLVPLPPSIWRALPGRENELAALSLVGEQRSWRPLSLSPSRTLASLLAIMPPLFCVYAMSRIASHERRLVLGAVVLMAVVTALLGAFQITEQGKGFNLYSEWSVGWISGFQANRNSAADLLLIGIVALAVLVSPYLRRDGVRLPLRLDRRSFMILSAGTGFLLFIATVMTGSRTGTLLILIASIASVTVISLDKRRPGGSSSRLRVMLVGVGILALLGVVFLILAKFTAVGQVTQRFTEPETRTGLWKDAWFALKQYWPAGFGMGGFEPAIFAVERLEFLNPSIPNRAHNDYLEIGLEAGVLGLVMLAAAASLCIIMVLRAWRKVPAQRDLAVFGTGVLLIVALHSTVDYPLRSMAIACLTGIAAGGLACQTKPIARQAVTGRSKQVKGLA